MAKKNLVIVESPTKVKAIKKFLGSNYEVAASNGHVRDLPKSRMGVDVEHDYDPQYITIRGKGELLAGLRKMVKKADHVYLATDPDREGEAIAWHLIAALKLEENKSKELCGGILVKPLISGKHDDSLQFIPLYKEEISFAERLGSRKLRNMFKHFSPEEINEARPDRYNIITDIDGRRNCF